MPNKQLADGTNYEKATHHSETTLKGTWEVTRKIDGVRAIRDRDGNVVSRNSKPLYNLDHLKFADCEVFRKDWSTSVSLVRSKTPQVINPGDIYELQPGLIDERLKTGIKMVDPSFKDRIEMMERFVQQGYEGIVLRKLGAYKAKWVKVVPVLSVDVRIIGYKLGTGKNEGILGSFETAHGSVGSGLTDADRKQMTLDGLDSKVGSIIEVHYREKTSTGKLRFPAFVRFRFDKDEESMT